MVTESDDGYLHVSPEAMLHEDHTYKPSSPAANDAYRHGKCKVCLTARHRPGGTECYDCYYARMDNLGVPLPESEHHGS